MKKKVYRYTCANCGTEQTFRPGQPEERPLLESREPEQGPPEYWPVCPKCNARNRIAPTEKKS